MLFNPSITYLLITGTRVVREVDHAVQAVHHDHIYLQSSKPGMDLD